MTQIPDETSATNANDDSTISGLTFDQRQRLTDLLDSYLVNLENDVPTNVDRMIRENPDIAGTLTSYLGQLLSLIHI